MNPQTRARWQELAIVILLPLMVFAIYVSGYDTTSLADPVWTLNTSLSVLKTGQPYLDQYPYAEAATIRVGGHRLYAYPLATPYLIIPAVAVIDAWQQQFRAQDMYERLQQWPDVPLIAGVHLVLASAITALSTLVIYAIGRRFLNRWRSVLLALIFAFATSAWSTASRDLWQHTFSVLFLSLALYLLLLARARPGMVFAAGMFLALAYVVRPTNSIAVLLLSIYVLIEHRRFFPAYLAGALLVAVPFFAFNRAIYGEWLPPYFSPGKLSQGRVNLTALAGTLVSPSRGLLIFSPVFLFAAYGAGRKARLHQLDRLDLFLLAIVVLHWLLMSYWAAWWAGDSYGPRFFTDILPFLMYFLIPVVAALTRPNDARAWAFDLTFGLGLLVSVGMHYGGGMRGESWRWNIHPPPSAAANDLATRVWDWSDPQFLRGMRPGEVVVVPDSLVVTVREGDPMVRAEFAVGNIGYSSFDWTIRAPNRVDVGPTCGPLFPFTGCRVALAVNTAGYAVGLHEVGTLRMSAQRAGLLGGPVTGALSVVPVSVRVVPVVHDAD